MIHLDTNFLIRAVTAARSAEADRLREWLRAGIPIGVSVTAWAEYLCGPVTKHDVTAAARIVADPVPTTAADAVLAARLFNASGRRRGTLADCLIAATAIRSRAELATANADDFRRMKSEGLVVA